MNQLKKAGWMLVFAGILYGCTQRPYSATNKVYSKQAKEFASRLKATPSVMPNDTIKTPEYFVGTTNFSMRKPNYVIIHHTEQNSCEKTLKTFTLSKTEVSAHYVICRDGLVHHMLNDYMRAHHAGLGKWGSVTDMNSCSIGIELDNNGDEPFSEAQINSLLSLLGKLKKDYNIPAANIIGHSDWSPTRKKDPSMYFPWKKLADHGFGLWFDDTQDTVAENFNHLHALKIIGYDTRDTGAAILAFKRHFMQDNSRIINAEDKKVLNNLINKY